MYSELRRLLAEEIVLMNEPMKNHTTFKIGGPVDMMVCPRSVEEIKTVVQYCREHKLPYMVLGMGSNLLVMDKGIRGVVIKLARNFQAWQIAGEQIWAQAGLRLSELAKIAAAHELSGLEFAEGIPGSLGGAAVMNAGAYGGEMKNVILEVEALSEDGEVNLFPVQELGYGYRRSNFQSNHNTVLAVRMQLCTRSKEEILTQMHEYARSRREKQPLEYPSAGSTFRRPPGYYVGPMIEELSLKGCRIGGAEVSLKHAGFIINTGEATARDVLQLISKIQQEVQNKFGVELKPEIRIVGEP